MLDGLGQQKYPQTTAAHDPSFAVLLATAVAT